MGEGEGARGSKVKNQFEFNQCKSVLFRSQLTAFQTVKKKVFFFKFIFAVFLLFDYRGTGSV